MKTARIEFVPAAAKDYQRLEPSLKPRAVKAFERIAAEPLCGKPLQGPYAGLRSFRFGDYRIVYRPDAVAGLAVIYRIGHRRDVYR